MIVVAIISTTLAIALPNYFKMTSTSKRAVCLNNLKQINGAIDNWAIDSDVSSGVVPNAQDEATIYGYLKSGKPKCPSGGAYTIYAVGANPQTRCSREDEGHVLP